MVELKKVTSDDVYETIHQFVTKGELVVQDYDSMIEVILSMIKLVTVSLWTETFYVMRWNHYICMLHQMI